MMIGGAGFATLSAIMLNHEGLKAMGDDAPTGGIFIKFVQYLGFGGHPGRPVGVPDRVRLRRPAVPPGVPADADRRRGRASAWWRPA